MAILPQINPDAERYNIRKLRGFIPGASDMASMIEDAAANALAKSQMLWLPSSIAAYPVGRTLTLPAGLDVWLDGASYITRTDGSQTEPTVVVGDSGTLNTLRTIRLTVRRGSVASQGLVVSNWQDNGCAGILLHNVSDSKLDLGAWRHTVGIEFRGTELDSAYNEVYLRKIVSNRIGLRLRAIGVGGWVNQNTFYKGRFATDTDIYSGAYASYYPIGVLLEGTFNGVNSNVFYHPNFEILTENTQWQDAVCCEIDSMYASLNVFHIARHENDSQYGSRFFRVKAPGTFGNRAILCYSGSSGWPLLASATNGPALLEYKINDAWSKLTTTVVSDMFTPVENGPGVWHSGSLGAIAKRCDAAGHISVPGMYWNAGSTRTRFSTGTGHTVPSTGRHLRLDGTAGTEYLCIMLDTSLNKRFLIKPNIALGDSTVDELRIFVCAVDSDRTTVLNKFGAVLIPGAGGNITNTSGVIGPISVSAAYRGKGYNGAPAWRAYGGSGTGLSITPNMAGTAGVDQYINTITVNNGGTGYHVDTQIVFDTVPGGDDVRLSYGLPDSFYFGGVRTQGNGAGGQVCEAGTRTKFVEACVGVVTGAGNVVNLESITIQTLDQYPIQPANFFLDQDDPTQPWVLEQPQTSWLTNGGIYVPGDFVANGNTATTDGAARPLGWIYTGAEFVPVMPDPMVISRASAAINCTFMR